MNNINYSRYEQHIELPKVGLEGQEKIHSARVLIVGSGGLGNPVALYLTASGIGKIGIIDADRIEESNLQRQILFSNEDVAHTKVSVAKSKLDLMASNQNIVAYPYFLDKKNAESIIGNYDLVIDATDNHIARLIINKVCLTQKKPWIYGSVYHFEGQVMTFNNEEDSPCFTCVFSDINEDSTLPTCKSAGILSPVPGIVGCMQANEALKIILNLNSGNKHMHELCLIDFLNNDFKKINVLKNTLCNTCGMNEA